MFKNPRRKVISTETVKERPYPFWPKQTNVYGVLECGHRVQISAKGTAIRSSINVACCECGLAERAALRANT